MPLACHASETMQTIQPARKSVRSGWLPAGRRQQSGRNARTRTIRIDGTLAMTLRNERK